ncbi:glutathione S-transferase, partial [Mycena rosella]
EDNGFVLYEGRAICRYLEEKYPGQGTSLIPTSLQEKALFEQAASIEFADFFPPLIKIGTASVMQQRQGLPIEEAALEEAKSELNAKLEVYEVILGKQKFLGGDKFTLADLFHLCYTPALIKAGVDVMADKGPNVTRWWNEIISRPAWVKLQAEGIKSVGV